MLIELIKFNELTAHLINQSTIQQLFILLGKLLHGVN
jgi:hypothetical protein